MKAQRDAELATSVEAKRDAEAAAAAANAQVAAMEAEKKRLDAEQ